MRAYARMSSAPNARGPWSFDGGPLLRRWKLQTGAARRPRTGRLLSYQAMFDADRGPVLKIVEYQVRPDDRGPFLEALDRLGSERRRDGAFEWAVFEDLSPEGRFLETFKLDSWVEHLRQREPSPTPIRAAATRSSIPTSRQGKGDPPGCRFPTVIHRVADKTKLKSRKTAKSRQGR
jgi:hypothetical protein